ncbi:hypothetical protein GGS21DRAFT_307041 [Xylaria nigripes]|nr:hypothetical protein GGS21DRAFT_307041 [Xylaria nigripes]
MPSTIKNKQKQESGSVNWTTPHAAQQNSIPLFIRGPFVDFLDDTDTDTDNLELPHTRRWAWYCKDRACPGYYAAWLCKTNFLLHLCETPVHREDPVARTRAGRRELARAWRVETTRDLSEPKQMPPQE